MAPGTRASSSNSHSRPLASSVRANERTYGEAKKSHCVTRSCGKGASAQSLTTHDQYAAHVHTYTRTPHTHSSSRPSLLTPCGAGGQRGKRGGQKEITGRSPRQNMAPRIRVQSHERLKASYTQRLSSILILSQVTWGLREPHAAVTPWASPLSTARGLKEAVSK